MSVDEVIALLHLKPQPQEGGFFHETYRSEDRIAQTALPGRYRQDKHAGTAIYYLLTPNTFSALHRLPTDEVFHFYLGDPVTMLQLGPEGGRTLTIGTDLRAGQRPQVMAPRSVWQGSFLQPGGTFALMGTTMAPAFDFADYEAGDRQKLCAEFPAFTEMIHRLTRTP
ncbi:MAG: cupin domain-containing protein [Gemmataceae bacterium]|nr:cupin domain-containing protein [Gemmataceae bacterium]